MKLSCIIVAKNEEKNLIACLKTISWCDEIIVIDDYSQDNTAKLAKKRGARVYVHQLNNNFSQQRNYGLQKAKGEWVLFVDADERISKSLKKEIVHIINNPSNKHSGFFISRKDFIWGKKLSYGETGNIQLLRLAKKDAGKWYGTVHETWQVNGSVGTLQNELSHYPHKSIRLFLAEINKYTTIRAKELYRQGAWITLFSIILYPFGKFIYNYFLRLGFLDEIPGLLIAIMMSFHSFLVRSKLWLMSNK